MNDKLMEERIVRIAKKICSAEATAIDIINEVRNAMKSKGRGDWRSVQGDETSASLEVRHWGEWEYPDDISEEDEEAGDYDWEVITEKYDKIMSDIGDEYTKKYKNFSVSMQTGEKNWIYIEVKKKIT